MAQMRDHMEATHMNSSEGEKVELKGDHLLYCLFSISLSPLPSFQGWLCDVESMMHVTLKDILRACRIDLKKHLNKRDKWIRDWPGQVGKETDF